MIKIKIKVKPTGDLPTVSLPIDGHLTDSLPTDIFNSQLSLYIDRVIEQLGKTQIKPDLIVPLEMAIRNKVTRDATKLFQEKDYNAYKSMYLTTARHIISNLKTDNEINNAEFIEKINSLQLPLDKLVELNPQDMHSERWRTFIEKKKSDIEKLTQDPEATTALFTCSRCHRNKCTFFERQDRSADEPMTIHITCCFCGKKWRQ